jgi:hypothetical protein
MNLEKALDSMSNKKDNETKKGFSNNQKWVFTIVLSALLLLFGYKIILANFIIDLTNFSFSEFLSLIMAIFAVSLSAAFYFKATDSSSEFYNNTYKFTKDIAELLTKIESGFGEQLKNLNAGNRNILSQIEKSSFFLANAKEKEKEAEEEVLKTKEKERKLIKDLENKSNLGPNEKEELKLKLEKTRLELSNKEKELITLKHQITKAETTLGDQFDIIPKVFNLIKYISLVNQNKELTPFSDFIDLFGEALNLGYIDENTLTLMEIQKFIKNNTLTPLGERVIREHLVFGQNDKTNKKK